MQINLYYSMLDVYLILASFLTPGRWRGFYYYCGIYAEKFCSNCAKESRMMENDGVIYRKLDDARESNNVE